MAETETAPEHVAPLTTLTEEETMLRDTVRQFAQQEIAPRVRAMDEAQKLDPDILRQMFELGLMAIEAPPELGGAGASFFSAVLAVEEIARVDPAVAVIVDVQNTLAVNALLRWGTAEQRQMWLPRMAQQAVCAYALSEAGSGSDAFSLTTQARPDGHDYVLNGRKLWISVTRWRRICFWSSPPSIRRPGIAASPPLWSSAARPASPWATRKTRWAFAPRPPASCSSTTAACRPGTSWATWARATRLPLKR